MPSPPEQILTTRRARWRAPGEAWTAGRLRLTERRLLLLAPGGGAALDVVLADLGPVRTVRLPRSAILLETPAGAVHLRCFEVVAVARLLDAARPDGTSATAGRPGRG